MRVSLNLLEAKDFSFLLDFLNELPKLNYLILELEIIDLDFDCNMFATFSFKNNFFYMGRYHNLDYSIDFIVPEGSKLTIVDFDKFIKIYKTGKSQNWLGKYNYTRYIMEK